MAATWEFQSVPIDFDVFKELTSRLESPTDTYNAVLRRLLRLAKQDARTPPASLAQSGWTVDGVTFPEGTRFRGRYKGKDYFAAVHGGALEFDGKTYHSPSPAAIAITGTSVNGWRFWKCQKPGQSDWVLVDGLRRK